MSNTRIVFSGLDELRADLRALPETSAREATHVVEATANAAAFAIKSEYANHYRTGKLQRSVVVEARGRGGVVVALVVRVKSKLAHLVEYGTQARHTAIGANRGSMPPAHVVGRIAPKHRRSMYESLKEVLRRSGAVVTGDV